MPGGSAALSLGFDAALGRGVGEAELEGCTTTQKGLFEALGGGVGGWAVLVHLLNYGILIIDGIWEGG